MADFCKACSILLFGEDYKELAGVTTPELWQDGGAMEVICEGCGPIQVDPEGNCVSSDCICKGKPGHGLPWVTQAPPAAASEKPFDAASVASRSLAMEAWNVGFTSRFPVNTFKVDDRPGVTIFTCEGWAGKVTCTEGVKAGGRLVLVFSPEVESVPGPAKAWAEKAERLLQDLACSDPVGYEAFKKFHGNAIVYKPVSKECPLTPAFVSAVAGVVGQAWPGHSLIQSNIETHGGVEVMCVELALPEGH